MSVVPPASLTLPQSLLFIDAAGNKEETTAGGEWVFTQQACQNKS